MELGSCAKLGHRAGTGRREQGKAGVTCCCWQCHSRSPSSCATLTAPTPGSREMVRSLNTHLQTARIHQHLCKELLASLCCHYFILYSDAFCIFNNFHLLENKICPSCSLKNYFIGIIIQKKYKNKWFIVCTTLSTMFSENILAPATLDLFFPFQMFPTELWRGNAGAILGSARTKKANHDRTS